MPGRLFFCRQTSQGDLAMSPNQHTPQVASGQNTDEIVSPEGIPSETNVTILAARKRSRILEYGTQTHRSAMRVSH